MSEQLRTNAIDTIWRNKHKFDTDNPEEDVFFVDRTTIGVEVLAFSTEDRLKVSIPQLTPGSYALETWKRHETNDKTRKDTLSEVSIIQ